MINIGMISPMDQTPEVDPINAPPRVKIPVLLLNSELDPLVSLENAEQYFEPIGTPSSDKKHVVAIVGHYIPRDVLIRESLDWLDRYLGKPSYSGTGSR